jgi:hypothetical protein
MGRTTSRLRRRAQVIVEETEPDFGDPIGGHDEERT